MNKLSGDVVTPYKQFAEGITRCEGLSAERRSIGSLSLQHLGKN